MNGTYRVKLTNDNTNIKRSAANINYQRFFELTNFIHDQTRKHSWQ